jgi:hypothetical protein
VVMATAAEGVRCSHFSNSSGSHELADEGCLVGQRRVRKFPLGDRGGVARLCRVGRRTSEAAEHVR